MDDRYLSGGASVEEGSGPMRAGWFSVNTFDGSSLSAARRRGMGLEVEHFLWPCGEEELLRKREDASRAVEGFASRSFHGSAVSRDISAIYAASDGELTRLYNQSFELAQILGVEKIVYHSNFFARRNAFAWVGEQARFWKEFLRNKPAHTRVYLENFIDDDPAMLADVCDSVDDPRFMICLDTGHAGCHSGIPLCGWVSRLGKRVGHVHLHDNDGDSDKHWAPGRGVLPLEQALTDIAALTCAQAVVLECDYGESLRWIESHFGPI